MERFDLPTEGAADQHVSTATSWSPSAGRRGTARPSAAPRTPHNDEPLGGWDPDETVPPPSSYAGLVGIGAVGGCAAAAGIGALAGWTGAPLTFAALIGLDVGVLAGAGVGSLLARRRARTATDVPARGPAATES